MIDKTVARGLLPLVNGHDYEPLQDYVSMRLVNLQKQLEVSVVLHDILRLQGQITELRRLQGLREEARSDAK